MIRDVKNNSQEYYDFKMCLLSFMFKEINGLSMIELFHLNNLFKNMLFHIISYINFINMKIGIEYKLFYIYQS